MYGWEENLSFNEPWSKCSLVSFISDGVKASDSDQPQEGGAMESRLAGFLKVRRTTCNSACSKSGVTCSCM